MRATVQQYYMSNKLKSKATYLDYKNSELDGYDTSYYESGEIQRIARFTKDYQEGLHLTFYKNGQAKREEYYIEGVRTAGNCYTATGADTSYYEFEKFPQFPGGDGQLLMYFQHKIKYPHNAIKNGIQGQVVVSFVVSKSGYIDHVFIEKSVSKELDEHCVYLVKSMPRWIPGEQDGEKVDVPYKLPFNFK
jgi:protein TonB